MSQMTFAPERTAVLQQYERLLDLFHKVDYLVEHNPEPKNHGVLCEAYDAAGMAVLTFREQHNITKQEMNAWKKRDVIRCTSIAEALNAISPALRVH